MLLKTKHFGEIEIDESGIISFMEGLPGFENNNKFIVLCNNEDAKSPFKWLQCIDEPQLTFAVVDPFLIRKDYDIEVSDEAVKLLGIEKPEDMLIYSILVVPEDLSKITMNLKAPVVINIKNKKGMQVILDTDEYGVRHYILEELSRQEVAGDACSIKEERPVHSHK